MPSRKNSKRLRNSRRKMRGGQATTTRINGLTLLPTAMGITLRMYNTAVLNELGKITQELNGAQQSSQRSQIDSLMNEFRTVNMASQLAIYQVVDEIPKGSAATPTSANTLIDSFLSKITNTLKMTQSDIGTQITTLTQKFSNSPPELKSQITSLSNQAQNTISGPPIDLAQQMVVKHIVLGTPLGSVGPTTTAVGPTTTTNIVLDLIAQSFAKTIRMLPANIQSERTVVANMFTNATPAQKTQISSLMPQGDISPLAADLARMKAVQQIVFKIPV